ncbi:MAG: error-prone DNA polymerase [Acidobacteria bacterium]|nr:error-prone DNA polymerase [Acidobacteriota bacterium]
MYIELHSRSAFSFLEGASVPEALAACCAELEMPAMALLDRDGVYGAPRFHLAAQKAGVKAHIGAEVTIRHGPQNFFRLPLLVANRTGYQNLCRLLTRAKLRAPKYPLESQPETFAAATLEEVAEFAGGLICLTGGEEGPLYSALAQGGAENAKQFVNRLAGILGQENVYVELQRHFLRQEEARNQAAREIAASLKLPVVATNGVAHATALERELLDVLTAIRFHRTLDTAGRLLAPNAERHLKPACAMERLFADLPEAIARTTEISSRLEFTLADLGYRFPRYPVPGGETQMSFLRKLTAEGSRARYLHASRPRALWERVSRQVERELRLIEQLDLAGYFLIVWDIVRYCREHGILVQGRGSAANSAVCYSLGITAVDPVGMDLLFERFLSEERGEWPDIDLDLPSGDRRERVIQHVYERYGARGAAMTANVITYRGRLAAREMGKALGFDPETTGRLSAMVGSWEYKDSKDTLENQFRNAGFDLRHHRMRRFFDLCLAVQDLPRHLGQHSGGMVICEGTLDSVVPLEPASMPGRVVVQWDKDDCADLGIIKVDLLGLGMMAVLQDSLKLIEQDYARQVDLAQLPPDDPAVYAALQNADTVGMFQVESRAQMASLPRIRPARFYDLVVQVAIIRPGPIVGNMVNPYIKRRQGREPVTYPHPSLEPVLERTLGVPLFQEQLLRMAMIAAGFSGGEAEQLRRAFGFKRAEARMADVETRLRAGMQRNGISPEAQEAIIHSITSFALYGFPESHSASFALLAYASAYLKTHYLAAFTAALLNNQPMGFYHPATIVKDAQRHGLKVLPLDAAVSGWLCSLERWGQKAEGEAQFGNSATRQFGNQNGLALRLGLCYARGLREEAGRALVCAREHSPFCSIDDLSHRVPQLRRNELIALAELGALNTLPNCGIAELPNGKAHRRSALWQVERATRPAGALLEKFGNSIPQFGNGENPAPLQPMTSEERLLADFRGTGLTVGPHPMAYRRREMQSMGVRPAAELHRLPHGSRVKTAGSVICRQRPGTAKGFVFLSLEDETGIANAIVMPGLFEQYRFCLMNEKFLLVEGTLQNQDGVVSVKAERLAPLAITAAPISSHDFH